MARKKKKEFSPSSLDALVYGSSAESNPYYTEARSRIEEAERRKFSDVQSSATSTAEDVLPERSRAMAAQEAAKRARAAADQKREEEIAARKQKWFDPQTLKNTLGYVGHSVTDPLDELALSRRTADTAGADGIGILPAAEALFMGGYQALTGVPTDVELKAKVMNNRAAQTARIKDAQAMGISTTPLEVVGGLTRMPGEVATGGASYAAEDFNKEVAATGDVPRALDRSVKNSGLNAAFNMAVPGGKAITEVGLTAANKLAPAAMKALTPEAGKSATRLGAEEWAKHSLGTSALMTTYGGTQLGINKYTAVFSDSEAQRKYANDQLPENAGAVMQELQQQALTGLAIGGLMGVKGASMTAGKAKAESLMEIQNTMDDLARQKRTQATYEKTKAMRNAPPASPVRQGPLDQRPVSEQLLFDPTTPQPRGDQLFPPMATPVGEPLTAPRFGLGENGRRTPEQNRQLSEANARNSQAPLVEGNTLGMPTRFGLGEPVTRTTRISKAGKKPQYRTFNSNEFTPEQLAYQAEQARIKKQETRTRVEQSRAPEAPVEAPPVLGRENTPDAYQPLFGEDALPVPTSTPELGTLTNRTRGEVEAADLAPHVKEAQKLETAAKKASAAELSKAKAKWNADRRAVLETERAKLMDLPEAERVTAVARVNKQWAADNPAPTLESLQAAKAAVTPEVVPTPEGATVAEGTPAPVAKGVDLETLRKLKPDATEADVAAANASPAADDFSALVRATQESTDGLAQKSNEADASGEASGNRATLEDIETELTGKAGSGEVRTLNALQRNGHVRVVANEAFLPENAQRMPGSKKGWFEGDTAYIVADKLEKGNVVRDMLDVASHEVKHGVDLQGKPYTYSGISNKIIGTDANKRIVAKIEKLAAKGDETAKRIVDIASENPKTYELEVAAYALNRANAERGKVGAFAGVTKDLLSTVRTSAKALIGSDNVNIKDLNYLGKRMLAEVAESRGSLGRAEGEASDGLAMTVGEKYNNPNAKYKTAKDLPTYIGEDGKTRAQLSDFGSKLSTPHLKRLANFDRSTRLVDLLQDNDAVAGYKALQDAIVVASKDMPAGEAAAFGNRIIVSKKDAAAALTDRSRLLSLKKKILHETQHVIQQEEGFTRGGSPEEFMDPTDLKIYDAQLRAGKNYVAELQKAYDESPTKSQAEYEELHKAKEDYEELRQDPRYKDAEVHYNRIGGEHEAQLTERTSEIPQEEINPYPLRDNGDEYNMYNTESTVRDGKPIRERGEPVYVEKGGKLVAMKADGSEANVTVGSDPSAYRSTKAGRSADEGMAYKGMGQDAVNKAADKLDEVDGFLNKTLRSNGTIGEKLMELIRQRSRDAALFGEHAQSLRVAIGDSVDSMVKSGKTMEEATAYIADKVDALSRVATVGARETLALDLAKSEPLMAPVIDGFRRINDASRILIRQELEANKHLTTARLAELQKMWNNQWSYSTRAYAAFQGDAGVKYSEALVKSAMQARKKLSQGRTLTETEAKNLAIHNAATKLIKYSDLTMPKDLVKLSDTKREYLYDAWVPGRGYADVKAGLISRSMEAGKDRATAEADAIATLNKDMEKYRPRSEDAKELQAKADYIAESILGLRDNSDKIASVYRGARADDSIMKHRTDIPVEIRELLGEIQDPGLRLSLTLLKQGELIAGNKLLRSIKEQGIAEGWIMPAAEAQNNSRMGTAITEDYLGTLKGMVTTKDIGTVLNTSVDFINSNSDALTRALVDAKSGFGGLASSADALLQKTARGYKRVTVAYNPYSYGRDFVGSGVTLLANGTLIGNPLKQLEYYTKGGKVAIENIISTAKGGSATYSDLFEDAVQYGLFESVKVHELRTAFGSSLHKEINPGNSAAWVRNFKDKAGRTDAAIIQTRAMADAWTKIPIWLERVDALSKYYEAQGIKKTMSEIKAQAGRDIRKTTVTQEQVPAFAKLLETRGLTTFLPYYIASARALHGNYVLGYTDIVRALTEAKTPKARNIMLVSGTKRLAGSTAAIGAMTIGIRAIADAWNGDGDTEEERKKSLASVDALKKLMFPQARYGEVLYMGKGIKDEPLFLNISSIDPSGPVGDVIRILSDTSISDDEKGEAVMEAAFDTLTSLNKGPVDMFNFVAGVVNGKTPHKGETKLDRIAPTMASYVRAKMTGNGFKNLNQNDANNFLQLVGDYTPGWFNALDPNNKLVSDKNKLGVSVVMAGGRMEQANVSATLGGTGAKLKDFRKDTKDIVMGMVKQGDSAESIFKYVANRSKDEQKLTTKLLDTYNALTTGLGKSQSEAVTILRSNRLDPRDVANATKGKAFDSVYEMLNDPKGPLNVKAMATWNQNRARKINGDEQAAAREGRELMNKFRVINLKSGAIQQYEEVDEEEDTTDDD